MEIKFKPLFFIAAAVLLAVVILGFIKINELIERSEIAEKQLQHLTDAYAELKEKPTEIIRREVIKQKSQEEQLTAAVSQAAPAVVSIAITKNVPRMEVVYINPFGNDPFFGDFDIKMPQFKQRGVKEETVGAGTGFIISQNGHIVTNRHVVKDQNAKYTALLADGSQEPVEVVYRDQIMDLAILKIKPGNYSVAKIGDSDALKLGQSVFTVGNALGEYNNSVSVGIVSGLNRAVEAMGNGRIEKYQGIIQTDAAINRGNSGGPLVNLNGEVVGINVARANADNIGFAVPINAIKPIINSYLR